MAAAPTIFSMEAVQKWLGHASLKETERAYAFLLIDHLQQLVQETQGCVSESKEGALEGAWVIEHIENYNNINDLMRWEKLTEGSESLPLRQLLKNRLSVAVRN